VKRRPAIRGHDPHALVERGRYPQSFLAVPLPPAPTLQAPALHVRRPHRGLGQDVRGDPHRLLLGRRQHRAVTLALFIGLTVMGTVMHPKKTVPHRFGDS
jgi:hypothetical protein